MKMKQIKGSIIKIGFATLISVSSCNYAFADYIAKGVTLTSVANTYGQEDNFIVNPAGGTLNKCSGTVIHFPLALVTRETTHARAYSAALTAFATGSKVNIWGKFDTCESGTHIQLTK